MTALIHDLYSQAPPAQSRPEAANFPNQTYEMSEDRHLFQAPPQYPEPPKNMYYEVPKERPVNDRPPPIFPWELSQPKPTRVFAEDLTPTPSAPQTETTPSVTTDDDTTTETASPSTPTVKVSSPEPFTSFSRTNAWDDIPEIDRYISSLPQNRRANVQVLFNNISQPAQSSTSPINDPSITSPTAEKPLSQPQTDRRASVKITDFPTEIERPSLPVTPAPVRRPSFWGEERDSAGELPAAEGVPQNQNEWNPSAKLAELQRRQSEVLEKGPPSPPRPMPQRAMVGSTISEVPEGARIATLEEAKSLPTQPQPVPVFGTLNFGGGDASTPSSNAAMEQRSEEVAPTGS